MIHINGAHLSFGEQIIFDDLNLLLGQNQRIGLLGRNGTGKSTLLKAIAGQRSLDEGSISIDKTSKVAYMPQEVILQSDKRVFEEVLSASEAYQAHTYTIPQLEKKMAQESCEASAESSVEQYADLLEKYTAHEAAVAKEQAERILKGLGFKREAFDKPVSELSVGWKMRVVLAKLLLEDADFYLFDEPTNHLDLPAKEWFFEFLNNGRFGFLLVTHDRHYLDKACDAILALSFGNATYFKGNYTQYIAAEKQRREVLESSYNRQQKEITKKKALIDRFRAKSSKAKMAQSMMKQLDKMEVIELEPLEPTMNLRFPPVVRSGSVALTVQKVRHSFDDKELFSGVNGSISRGEKIALVAPNGTGKTTLFNILTGSYELQGGSVSFGHNITTAIFEQDQLKALDPHKTVYEEVVDAVSVPDSAIRSFLGSFLFSGDTVNKKIDVLSGGERNRVAMVKVLLAKANFLLLDEPTNHLDLFAKEVLLQALQQYEGTMLFVSHDHAFLQELATCIWELTPNGIVEHLGTYESYLEHKKEQDDGGPVPQKVAKKAAALSAKEQHAARKKFNSLERSIGNYEKKIAQLMQAFEAIEYGTEQFDEQTAVLKQAKDKLSGFMKEWEQLGEELV